MSSEAKTEALSDPIAEPGTDSGAPGFLSLRQSAALEFHASVQLLAERARFLTGAAGVAVALEQDGQFVFCAAAGSVVPAIGATADITRYPLRKCMKTGQPVQLPVDRLSGEASGEESHPALAVPLLRDEKVVGFFELAPGACALEDADVETVARLSAMVSTALDHRDAAEHTERLIGVAKLQEPAPPAGPVLWHAPEPDTSEPTPAVESRAPAPADVRACAACGFPVSGRRALCLDCEKHQDDPKNDPKADPNSPAELFATAREESWISAHGYTIASLLVTALAAAIIFWLR
jgi:hypothetical protein